MNNSYVVILWSALMSPYTQSAVLGQGKNISVESITTALYQEQLVPDEEMLLLLRQAPGNKQRIIFLRGYNAFYSKDFSLLSSLSVEYKQEYGIDSYGALLSYLATDDTVSQSSTEALSAALNGRNSHLNEFVHYQAYHALREVDEKSAIAHLDTAILIAPGFAIAALCRSYHFDSLEDCERIVALLGPFQSSWQDYDLQMYIAEAYFNCNDATAAKLAYSRAVALKPCFESWRGVADMMLSLNEDLRSVEVVYQRVLSFQDDAEVRVKLGWIYNALGHPEKARAEFVSSALADACSGRAIYGLMHLGEWEDASILYANTRQCERADFVLMALGVVLNHVKLHHDMRSLQELADEYVLIYSEEPGAVDYLRVLFQEFKISAVLRK